MCCVRSLLTAVIQVVTTVVLALVSIIAFAVDTMARCRYYMDVCESKRVVRRNSRQAGLHKRRLPHPRATLSPSPPQLVI